MPFLARDGMPVVPRVREVLETNDRPAKDFQRIRELLTRG
jgi:hypothetical protein